MFSAIFMATSMLFVRFILKKTTCLFFVSIVYYIFLFEFILKLYCIFFREKNTENKIVELEQCFSATATFSYLLEIYT